VDATGEIVRKWTEGDSLWVQVQAPPDLMPYIVPKGCETVLPPLHNLCKRDSHLSDL
jgi:hypothetical protein